jgi:hypothetical protein
MISHRGVRGSCDCYFDREDVTSVVLEEQLQLHQVEERCGRPGAWHFGLYENGANRDNRGGGPCDRMVMRTSLQGGKRGDGGGGGGGNLPIAEGRWWEGGWGKKGEGWGTFSLQGERREDDGMGGWWTFSLQGRKTMIRGWTFSLQGERDGETSEKER